MREFKVRLKTGEDLIIREAQENDAATILSYLNIVSDQSQFVTFTSDEFDRTVKEQASAISGFRSAQNQILLLGMIDERLVSMLHVEASPKRRLKHVGEFGLSVSKEHWKKGIASHMLEQMLTWAKVNQVIKKIKLEVVEANHGAIALYKKIGFKQEAILKKDFYENDKYYDSFVMTMWVDNS